MRRMVMGAIVAAAATMLAAGFPGSAAAQEPLLHVQSAVFQNLAGEEPISFAFGEPIRAFLEIKAGEQALTGISATLSDPRKTIEVGTATWPDLGPGEGSANTEPFEFRHGEASSDADCVVFLNEGAVPPDEEIVEDPSVDEPVATDASEDPSDPFEPIPSGGMVFSFTTDQGELQYTHPYSAVCGSAFAGGDGDVIIEAAGPGRLATTGPGATVTTAGLGLLFLGAGLALRARARLA